VSDVKPLSCFPLNEVVLQLDEAARILMEQTGKHVLREVLIDPDFALQLRDAAGLDGCAQHVLRHDHDPRGPPGDAADLLREVLLQPAGGSHRLSSRTVRL
jgi:hypothetical protein